MSANSIGWGAHSVQKIDALVNTANRELLRAQRSVGGKKLPELARGSGRAITIFKTEVRDDPVDTGVDDVVVDRSS